MSTSQPPCTHIVPIGDKLSEILTWVGDDTAQRLSGILTPGHIDELADLIRWAGKTQQKLVLKGRGSSAANPEVQNSQAPYWLVDLPTMDVPVEEFEESQMYWLPATSSLEEVEAFLRERNASLGVWARLYPQRSLGGAVASGLPLVRQAFYQRGPNFLAVDSVLASGKKIETHDAPRVAAGMGLRGLWNGSGGQMGAITRVLLSAENASSENGDYVIRTESVIEAAEIARTLIRSEFFPELALIGKDKNGPYLLWSHRTKNTRDIMLSDLIAQLALDRYDPASVDGVLSGFSTLSQVGSGTRECLSVRWRAMADACKKLDTSRKRNWLLQVAGTQGCILYTTNAISGLSGSRATSNAVDAIIDNLDFDNVFQFEAQAVPQGTQPKKEKK